jgi:hypothetical protein
MQFRLRTLLILLTILGVLFARIGYLKHKAESHRQRVSKLVSRIVEAKENVARGVTSEVIEHAVSVQLSDPALWKKIGEAQKQDTLRSEAFLYICFHQIMADRYDRALYRPWTPVSETE